MEQRCPYCGSSVKPFNLRVNLYVISFSLEFYHCKVCGRWYERLNPNVEFLIDSMKISDKVCESLRKKYGATECREFLKSNFAGFTKELSIRHALKSIVASIKELRIRDPFRHHLIIHVKETDERYYLTCYRQKKKGQVIYYCDKITALYRNKYRDAKHGTELSRSSGQDSFKNTETKT